MLAAALVAAAVGVQAHTVAVSISRAGPRPAAGALERRAHRRMRRRFERAGLEVRVQRFDTPRGLSRNVIGIRTGEERCVRVLMAHADTVPPSPGAEDNASGLGLLAGLAPRLDALDPPCTIWLVATGAEERIYTGSPDHLGALALRKIVPRRRLRYALSLDEVGRGASFRLRSPVSAPRRRVERELLAAARGRRRLARLAARQRHRQLRPPRVRARRDARGQARRARQPVPARGVRHARPAAARGVPARAAGRRGRYPLSAGVASKGVSDERHPSVPAFEPLTRARRWRLVLGAAIGSVLWLVTLIVGAIVLHRTEAIELGLLIAGVSFAAALLVVSVLRALRRREERRYADGR